METDSGQVLTQMRTHTNKHMQKHLHNFHASEIYNVIQKIFMCLGFVRYLKDVSCSPLIQLFDKNTVKTIYSTKIQ